MEERIRWVKCGADRPGPSLEIRGDFWRLGRDGCQLTTRNGVTSDIHTTWSTTRNIRGTNTARVGERKEQSCPHCVRGWRLLLLQQSSLPSGPGCMKKTVPAGNTPELDRYVDGRTDGLGAADSGGRLHSRTAFKAVSEFGMPRRRQGMEWEGKGRRKRPQSGGNTIFSNTT